MTLDTTKALITVEEAKEYLKITGAGDDAILGALINSVSEWVCRFVGRNLLSASYVEYYSGDGSPGLMLNHYPVTAVASIYEDTLRVFGADTEIVVATNVMIRKEAGILQAWNLKSNWGIGNANIKVSYTAGYTAASGINGGTMPYDIRQAVKRILDQQYRTGYTHRKLDVSSESVGDQTTTFREGDVPTDAKTILEPYRQLMPSPHFSHAN